MGEIKINLIGSASLMGATSIDPTLQRHPHHGAAARKVASEPRLSPEQLLTQTQSQPNKPVAQPQGLAHAMMTSQAPLSQRKKATVDHKRIPEFLDDESGARSHKEHRRGE